MSRKWLRIAGALVAIVMSLCLVNTSRADALAGPLGPIAIGETLAGAAGEDAAAGVASGACLASVVCAGGVAAVGIGMFAYQTKDVWMPIVKGVLGAAFSSSGGAPPVDAKGCLTNGSAKMCITGASMNAGNALLDWSVIGSGSVSWAFTYRRVSCDVGTAVVSTTIAKTLSGNYSAGASGELVTGLCGGGQDVISYDGSLCPYGSRPCGSDPATAAQVDVSSGVPDRSLSIKTDVTCSLPDGSKVVITRSTTGVDGEVPMPSCLDAYGGVPTEVAVGAGLSGGEQPQAHWSLGDPRNDYPDCFDGAGAFLSSCKVRVWVNGQPCHVGSPSGCVNWETDSDDNGDKVECRFGTYVIPLSECSPLKKAYQTGTGTQTITTVDPTTGVPTDPSQVPATQPAASAASQPTTGTNPSSLPSTGTTVTTLPPPVTGPSDSASSNCWGTGWSWNPVSWVFVPVKCALSWAFVPDTGTWGLTDLQTAFTTRPPGSIVAGVGSIVGSIYGSWSGAGCGKLLDLDTSGIGHGHQVVTCPKIQALPGFSAAYVVVKAGVYGLTAFALWRMFLAAFGPKGD